MIIDINELRKKLKHIPTTFDKAFLKIVHDDESVDDELVMTIFKDGTDISFEVNIYEFDKEI